MPECIILGCRVTTNAPLRSLLLIKQWAEFYSRRPKRIALYGANTPRPKPGPVAARPEAAMAEEECRGKAARLTALRAAENAKLTELWANRDLNRADIAKLMGLTLHGVRSRARRLRLPNRGRAHG